METTDTTLLPALGDTWRLEAGKTLRVVDISYSNSGSVVWFQVSFGRGLGAALGGLTAEDWQAEVLPRGLPPQPRARGPAPTGVGSLCWQQKEHRAQRDRGVSVVDL